MSTEEKACNALQGIPVERSLCHYHTYTVAKQNDDRRYLELADRLQRKGPPQEQGSKG